MRDGPAIDDRDMNAAMLLARAGVSRRAGWLSLVALLTLAPRVHAQTNEELARARGEFREAIALQAAGDYAGALAKLQSVAAVRMTPQVRFNIAVCEKNLGKLVAALGNFTLAQSEALDQDLEDVAAKAEEHIEDIRARIPKLTIVRGEGAETAAISLDGVALGAAVIGTEMNVDPGPHLIVATQDGETRFSTKVELAERAVERIVVRFEAPVVATSPKPAPMPIVPDAIEPEPSGWTKQHSAWTALGVGGAGTIAGVVFLVLRSGTISDLDAVCIAGHCPPSAEPTADRGKLYTGLAGASFVVGAAGLGLGGYLLFGDKQSEAAASSRTPTLAWTTGAPGAPAGASLVGSF